MMHADLLSYVQLLSPHKQGVLSPQRRHDHLDMQGGIWCILSEHLERS